MKKHSTFSKSIQGHKKILFFCSEGLPYIEGLFFILLGASVLTLIYFHWALIAVDLILCFLLLEICYFFRDPDRISPPEPGSVLAPADGKVISIQTMEEKSFLERECVRLSIFMNIFNVHVNRAPISGKIVHCQYNPGKFISAFKEKSSLDNEQVLIGIEATEKETKKIRILVKLIAGFIARRIILWKETGSELTKGERISLIKFGSRVDIYLPLETRLKVKKGDWVKAGKTVIGDIKN